MNDKATFRNRLNNNNKKRRKTRGGGELDIHYSNFINMPRPNIENINKIHYTNCIFSTVVINMLRPNIM